MQHYKNEDCSYFLIKVYILRHFYKYLLKLSRPHNGSAFGVMISCPGNHVAVSQTLLYVWFPPQSVVVTTVVEEDLGHHHVTGLE